MGEVVDVKWSEHPSSMQSLFEVLRESGDLADMTLTNGTRSLRCHRLVLSAAGSKFHKILKEYSGEVVVYMDSVDSVVLDALVQFIYRGEANIPQNQLREFMQLAARWQVRGVLDGGCTIVPTMADTAIECQQIAREVTVEANVAMVANSRSSTTTPAPASEGVVKRPPLRASDNSAAPLQIRRPRDAASSSDSSESDTEHRLNPAVLISSVANSSARVSDGPSTSTATAAAATAKTSAKKRPNKKLSRKSSSNTNVQAPVSSTYQRSWQCPHCTRYYVKAAMFRSHLYRFHSDTNEISRYRCTTPPRATIKHNQALASVPPQTLAEVPATSSGAQSPRKLPPQAVDTTRSRMTTDPDITIVSYTTRVPTTTSSVAAFRSSACSTSVTFAAPIVCPGRSSGPITSSPAVAPQPTGRLPTTADAHRISRCDEGGGRNSSGGTRSRDGGGNTDEVKNRGNVRVGRIDDVRNAGSGGRGVGEVVNSGCGGVGRIDEVRNAGSGGRMVGEARNRVSGGAGNRDSNITSIGSSGGRIGEVGKVGEVRTIDEVRNRGSGKLGRDIINIGNSGGRIGEVGKVDKVRNRASGELGRDVINIGNSGGRLGEVGNRVGNIVEVGNRVGGGLGRGVTIGSSGGKIGEVGNRVSGGLGRDITIVGSVGRIGEVGNRVGRVDEVRNRVSSRVERRDDINIRNSGRRICEGGIGGGGTLNSSIEIGGRRHDGGRSRDVVGSSVCRGSVTSSVGSTTASGTSANLVASLEAQRLSSADPTDDLSKLQPEVSTIDIKSETLLNEPVVKQEVVEGVSFGTISALNPGVSDDTFKVEKNCSPQFPPVDPLAGCSSASTSCSTSPQVTEAETEPGPTRAAVNNSEMRATISIRDFRIERVRGNAYSHWHHEIRRGLAPYSVRHGRTQANYPRQRLHGSETPRHDVESHRWRHRPSGNYYRWGGGHDSSRSYEDRRRRS